MGNEVVKKTSLTSELASKFNMEAGTFLSTIKSTVMPNSAKNEEIAAFLMVAKEYDLNPITREIHAFPKKGGGIQTVVGVDGWCKIITRHNNFNGVDFDVEDKDGKPYSVTCTLYRKDTKHPVKITEYFDECYRKTDPWNTMPRRMLRHKAFMQCGRIAFGISGICDKDEASDFCEVTATVITDDPLAPGRHEKKKKPKKEEEKPVDSDLDERKKYLEDGMSFFPDEMQEALDAYSTTIELASEEKDLYDEVKANFKEAAPQ